MDGPFISLKQEELLVLKSKKEWNEKERISIQLNVKIMHTLFCALGPDKYNRESSCSNAKEI
ncbi:UBN2 domain-containing protein [Gossypium australe]|uniref:UBN2 domain-containing protein n=1 Tax=Gossypium australe TaxID=47621 RepID=A0A5B6VCB5_9ROSI|nr:UBN2 domain-containing protein [Gossypium australe]